MRLLFVGVALMSAIFTGCNQNGDDDNNDPDFPDTDNLIVVANGYTDAGQIKVILYAFDSVTSAYTPLFIELRDSATNTLIEDATITLMPMMDMGQMQHSAPFENPASTDAVDGLFPCAVVFQMPGEMGWSLKVDVLENVNGGQGEVTFQFGVNTDTPSRTHVVTPLNGNNPLIISYLEPTSPAIGMNDLELTLHTKASMMSFPGEDSYTIEIEPLMPSMGHGSPNNVDPTHSADGHYNGQVNFTMTGLWVINLTIMDGTEVVDSTSSFEMTIQ